MLFQTVGLASSPGEEERWVKAAPRQLLPAQLSNDARCLPFPNMLDSLKGCGAQFPKRLF
jgi:hypothetical protein